MSPLNYLWRLIIILIFIKFLLKSSKSLYYCGKIKIKMFAEECNLWEIKKLHQCRL